MRRLVWLVMGGLLMLVGNAWGGDSFVRWDRIEGFKSTTVQGSQINGFTRSARLRTVGEGRVMLNLKNGFLSFSINGMASAEQYPNLPLGAPPADSNLWIGTIVCDSLRPSIEWVDSPEISLAEGSGEWQGFVSLPFVCVQRPEEIVFLLRHGSNGGAPGAVAAYGAGRTIQ